MAAEFKHEALHRVGGAPVEMLADLGGAGEGQRPNAGIVEPGLDDRGGIPGDDVEDAGGKTCAFRELGQGERGERCLGGGVNEL